ncbi:MAG: protein kinase, partial [Chloroflexota bacterium]
MLDTNLNGSHLRFALVGSGPHGTVHKIPESGLIRAQKMIEADSILQHVPNFVENWSTFQRDMIGPEGANLVAVYAAESKEDYVSIRMSYQRGGCLRQLIRRRGFMPPNPQELYHLIDSVRAGMIEAESERNVKVHGNLKPENLLFAEYLKSNEPLWQSAIKLSDFGLLGLPQAVETHKAYDYREAWGYVAPEICTDLSLLKSHAKLKPSTDVYALAVIIYELLQGVRPRPVKSIQYWRQKETLVPTPEPKDGYSAPFWAVVLKGLAVEPENRFEDVDLFVKALEQFLQTPGDPPNRGEDGRSEAGPDISEPISSLNRVEIGQFEQHTEDTLIVTGGGTDASTGNEVTGAIFILRNDRISIGNHTKLGADSKKPDISLPHEHIAGY